MVAAGAATCAAAAFYRHPQPAGAGWQMALLAACAVLTGSRKVTVNRYQVVENAGSMTLAFAVTFAALMRFGPAAGVIIGSLGILSAGVYPKQQAPHQLLFNVGLAAVTAWLSGWTFLALNGWDLTLEGSASFPAVCGACLTYFFVNTFGVAVVLGLCKGQNPFPVWKSTFLWTAPSYFGGAAIASIGLLVAGSPSVTFFLFGAPVVYLTYHSYQVYTARAEEKIQHIEDLQHSQSRLADLYLATIRSLALAIDAKDQFTHQHILRVQRYAMATAKRLGLSGAELEGLETGALLHDIGKLGVPEYVLLKPGRLTKEEFDKIKKHPEIGAAILDPVEFPWPVLPVVKYHHEKWDGTGYPDGLKGDEIPYTARILAVCDVYDALTSNRSYRKAWTHQKAIEEIRRTRGSHFDPVIADAFLEVVDEVIQQMAAEGTGPLAPQAPQDSLPVTKADEAARDIRRASSELWALYEVSQTLSSSIGVQETLEILARKLEAMMPGTACLFALKCDAAEELLVRAAVGVNQPFFQGSRTTSTTSLSLGVLQRQATYMGVFDPEDLMVQASQFTEWQPLESALIVPITHQGQPLGTINLYHPLADAFGSHDQQVLETVAERAALALYNGMLFERTRSNAETDPLTGLHNVRYLTDHLEYCCSAGSDPGPFALLCLDLDSFKPINDNFGHQKGDEVLRDLARIFRQCVRADDVVARYGGDEFVVVVRGAQPEQAAAVAGKLEAAVAGYDPGLVHPRLGKLHIGASVGYACFPTDGTDAAALLAAADTSMYQVKAERKLGRLAGAHSDANHLAAFPSHPRRIVRVRLARRSLRIAA